MPKTETETDGEQVPLAAFDSESDEGAAETDDAIRALVERNADDIDHLREILESTIDKLSDLSNTMEQAHTTTGDDVESESYDAPTDRDIRGFQ